MGPAPLKASRIIADLQSEQLSLAVSVSKQRFGYELKNRGMPIPNGFSNRTVFGQMLSMRSRNGH